MTSQPAGDELDLLDRAGLNGPAADAGRLLLGADERKPRRWRESLGWSATSAPVALLLATGIGFGPQGINLLSSGVLSLLGPVVPVALAALGVLVGLGAGDRRLGDGRVFIGACLDVAVTMVVVSVGIAVVMLATVPTLVEPLWALVLIAGLCASTTLTLPTGNPLEPRSVVARVTELGVLLPILLGGLVLASLRAGNSLGALVLVAQATGVTLTLAAASWLLLTRVSSETEERVFAVAALLLVGGVADALSLSALLGGLAAAVFWRLAGRQPRATINRDVLFVQHPLLVLVLLVAGARVEPSSASLGLAAAYLLLRVVGKLAGGALAGRAIGAKAPRDLGRQLLSPGVFGVAFALNAVAILGAEASVLLTAVVIGTIGAELIAFLLQPRGGDA